MAAIEKGNEDAFKPYDQFLLFGDSITQMGCNQELGFAFHAALQECELFFWRTQILCGQKSNGSKNSLQSQIGCY